MINANKTYECILLNFTDMDLANFEDSVISLQSSIDFRAVIFLKAAIEENVTAASPAYTISKQPHISLTF